MMTKIKAYMENIRYFVLFTFVGLLTSCATDVDKLKGIKEDFEKQLTLTSDTYWGSELFSKFFDMLNDIYVNNLEVLTDISLTLLALGFGFWILFYSMKYVGALNNPNVIDYLNNVFKRGFVVLCIAAFLASPNNVRWLLDHTVILVLEAFSATSVRIMNSVMTGNSIYSGNIDGYSACPEISLSGLSYNSDSYLNGIRDSFSCVIVEAHKQLAFGIAFAKLMKSLANGLGNMILGFFFVIIFQLIDLVFPLFLVDGLFKFMIALILSPLFIAAWAFNATRSFSKKSWKLVMGIGMQILFTVVFICFAIMCVRAFVHNGGGSSIIEKFMDPSTYSDNADATDLVQEIKSFFDKTSDAFALVFCSLFLLLLTDKVSGMAGEFTGSPATSIVASTIKNAVKLAAALTVAILAVAATGGAALKSQAKKFAKKAGDAASNSIQGGSQ